jgi:hypothetical protein
MNDKLGRCWNIFLLAFQGPIPVTPLRIEEQQPEDKLLKVKITHTSSGKILEKNE